MVGPKPRRAVVAWAQETYRVSERRACRGLWVHRALVRDHSVKPDDAPLRGRLRELAGTRPSDGVKRLHVLLRRDGLHINLKKVHRLYREERMRLTPRRRRRRAATTRWLLPAVTQPNRRWAMDCMHDVLSRTPAEGHR
jgi:putative transposase